MTLFDNTFGRNHPDTKSPVEQPDTRGRTINHATTPTLFAQENSPK